MSILTGIRSPHRLARRPGRPPGRAGTVSPSRRASSFPFLMALALVPFRTDLSHTNAAPVLVVAVVAVAVLGSRTAGVVAALSAAWFDFSLTRPYDTFDIEATADIETAVLLLVVGLVVS